MIYRRYVVMSFLLLSCGDDDGGPGTGDEPTDGASDAGNTQDSATDSGSTSIGATDGGGKPAADASATTDVTPLTQGTWRNVTGNLAGMESECGNMSSVTAKPDEDLLIAGVARLGLWASTQGGEDWQQLGTGSGSASITNRPTQLVFDPMAPGTFYEAGLYNGNGVYWTQDEGRSFAALGALPHIDAVSVDFTDPRREVLLAGGHEQEKSLFRSTDHGATWQPVGASLPAKTNCSYPLVLDAQTHLVGCAGYGGGPTGILRTTNGGVDWTSVSTAGGAGAPLVASDGSIYWASAYHAGMVRSTDSGRSWTAVAGPNLFLSIPPIELPDGKIAALASEAVVISSDHGETWHAVTSKLPFEPTGVTYSRQRKAFFILHATCTFPTAVVPADAIMRFDYDYAAP
jgi:hypothetical protein